MLLCCSWRPTGNIWTLSDIGKALWGSSEGRHHVLWTSHPAPSGSLRAEVTELYRLASQWDPRNRLPEGRPHFRGSGGLGTNGLPLLPAVFRWLIPLSEWGLKKPFQRYINLDAQKVWTGLLKAMVSLLLKKVHAWALATMTYLVRRLWSAHTVSWLSDLLEPLYVHNVQESCPRESLLLWSVMFPCSPL